MYVVHRHSNEGARGGGRDLPAPRQAQRGGSGAARLRRRSGDVDEMLEEWKRNKIKTTKKNKNKTPQKNAKKMKRDSLKVTGLKEN